MRTNINEVGSFSQLFTEVIFEALKVRGVPIEELPAKLKDYYLDKFKNDDPLFCRAGFMTNQSYQKLIEDKLDQRTVSDILKALNVELGFMLSPKEPEAPKVQSNENYPAVWDQKIWELNLLPRTYNMLVTESTCTEPQGGLDYVGQLVTWSANALRKIPGMGVKSVEDIVARLADVGQSLDTDTGTWQPPVFKALDPRTLSAEISVMSELSNYIVGTLRNNGILYIGQLVKMSFTNLWSLDGIGLVSIEYIKQALERRKLGLGMDVGNWTLPKN